MANNPSKFIRRSVSRILKSLGYQLVPLPWNDWYELRRLTMSLFENLGINCVLDVGAFHGEYGTTLRQFGYQGRIVSFEPVPDHFQSLQQASKDDKNWIIHNLAL